VKTNSPPAMAPTDGELVRAPLAGEPRAFDTLVERHQRRATAVAYRLLGNLHDALEACQEAFVRAYRSLDSLAEPERFAPWLLRIVTNLSLNFRRSRAVGGPRLSFEDCLVGDDRSPDELVSTTPGSSADPEARMAAGELADLVQQAISELPELQRLALVLFSIEQLPQKEVASIMDTSVEAVKWHVFQARKKLRERLADYL